MVVVTTSVILSRGYGRSSGNGALVTMAGHGYIGRRSREGLVCAVVVCLELRVVYAGARSSWTRGGARRGR